MAVIPPIKRGKCVQEKERWENISDTLSKEKMDFMCVQREIYQKKITKADQEIQRYVTTLPGKKRIDV